MALSHLVNSSSQLFAIMLTTKTLQSDAKDKDNKAVSPSHLINLINSGVVQLLLQAAITLKLPLPSAAPTLSFKILTLASDYPTSTPSKWHKTPPFMDGYLLTKSLETSSMQDV